MKTLIILTLLGFILPDTTARSHSYKYFYTASSGVPDFPEFVAVGMVDDLQMIYFDSNTRRAVPKQDWMSRVTEDDPKYLKRSSYTFQGTQETFKANIEILKPRFNQTGGVHTVQMMVGCEWDDETKEVKGWNNYGYDGEDFVALDMETMTWNAPTPQAVITKQKWDNDKANSGFWKNYLTQTCPDWLKKYVEYGRSSLMRTDLPSVSLLQKSPSSPVTCHASGFYPDRAMMFWRKDGEELHEDVDLGETLPNNDGSFQMSADLKVPSDDWGKYECVFQLAGQKDIITKLDKTKIRTNRVKPLYKIPIVLAVLILLSTIVCAGVYLYKRLNAKLPPSPVNNSGVEREKLLPNPNA
ncbi:Hypothetical predicted protein [Xyrichtys novacula]|uniref:Ig-like domain-containing protein n=1 Tax=Xyrichtys novacula TaxID=13765 RepID=A0AAV1HAI3_XYRNO|nr:Hypothetical predicted protein [Xyrichtys novacula]